MESTILELRKNGLTYNEISKKINVSKSLISYYLKKNNMNTPINDKGVKISKQIIDKIVKMNNDKISKKEISKILNISYTTVKKYTKKRIKLTEREKKENEYSKNKKWRVNIKLQCVNFLGGKCSVCGYNKCLAALDLHHVNGNDKDFVISGPNLKSFEKLKPELNKCVVLCSNCHRETHFPHLIGLL